MRNTGWMTVIAAALVMVSGVMSAFAADETTATTPAITNAAGNQVLCPVMGGKVDKSLYVDADGKRVYVCCRGCVGDVKKNPAKYIKKLEAEGITLASTPQAATTNAPAATPPAAKE